MAPSKPLSPVGALLRQWRERRGMSQLALATQAGTTSRYASFVETGRARPSRQMVLRLAEVLDIPLRERNALLEAAGFAPHFHETPLDAPRMAEVRRVLDLLLRSHTGACVLVVNRRYELLLANDAALRLFGALLPPEALAATPLNLVHVTLSPAGLRPFIDNWDDVARSLLHRLQREALQTGDREVLQGLLEDPSLGLAELLTRAPPDLTRPADLLLPLRLRKGTLRLDLIATLTTLGTPQDITLQEVRIETLFPADVESEQVLARLCAQEG